MASAAPQTEIRCPVVAGRTLDATTTCAQVKRLMSHILCALLRTHIELRIRIRVRIYPGITHTIVAKIRDEHASDIGFLDGRWWKKGTVQLSR